LGWLLGQTMARARADLGHDGPRDPVTGQELRLFLALVMENDPVRYRGDLFVTDEQAHGDELAQTWDGLVAAPRLLANYGEPYGIYFSEFIAHYLGLPIQ